MNPALQQLKPYPFERLSQLLANAKPPPGLKEISLGVGEPQHPVPELILEALQANLGGIAHYPNSLGSMALREAIAYWLTQRFKLTDNGIDPNSQILPVCGTREALFAFAQAVIDNSQPASVLMPNPFYQIYEGASLLAGAQPEYVPCSAASSWLPDFGQVSEAQWQRCQLLYICSPGNPTGAVLGLEALKDLLELAQRYDFIVASDECYSEIYLDEQKPPAGLLQAAADMGNTDFKRCVVFHSLSKRSNVPGMRSGFVAGDAQVLAQFRRYRTYHGSTMSPAVQSASAVAWADEAHVEQNRKLYRAKFDGFLQTLDAETLDGRIQVSAPSASFYLWPRLNLAKDDDESFTRRLLCEAGLRVLPGRYLARDVNNANPGKNHLRLSLVASVDDCQQAAQRIRELILAS
ncbi:MAG: succinyldiaminopimelate transaminase [Salinisphaeraceae bacterium]|nr:succinyldiaminopimelate transaminase [Salinisphaeraceae bacterium]